jgi:hypothetical protein
MKLTFDFNFKFCYKLLLLFLLFNISTHSQSIEICGTADIFEPDPAGVYSRSSEPSYFDTFTPKTFDIFFWRINKNDGSYTQGGTPLTPERARACVQYLNESFASSKICFNLVGMDTINSTIHHSGQSGSSINTYAVNNNYAKADAFNVYVPHLLNGAAGNGYPNRAYIGVTGASVLSNALIHELGHNFNLHHTFGPSNTRPHPENCERVTRLVTDPEYNADVAGDEITDTNAVPNFFREQHNYFAYAVEQAEIGYTWSQARQLAFLENGFSELTDAQAIEQALIDYGFTQDEVDYLRFNPAKDFAYCDTINCTYDPDNRINDPTSPFFKDCGMTPYQINQLDCRNTMSYFYRSCRDLYTLGQSIRMQEAIEEDYWGEFTPRLTQTELDLYMQDTDTDTGQEPNIHTNIFWNSQDIWVRNQNDGLVNQEHQNPEYDPVLPNFVYVNVRNKSCNTSTGSEQLKLYWAKANTALSWPLHWEGNLYVVDNNGQQVLMGDEIGTLTIPEIEKGESTILEFEWDVPNQEVYMNINNDNPWHFCLLARMISTIDPMTFSEGEFITDNVKNNNNIAWRNTTVVDINPNSPAPVGGVVAVGNFMNTTKNYNLEFFVEENEAGKPIYEESEISILLDDILYNSWNSSGKASTNFSGTFQNNKIIVENNHAVIENLTLTPGEIGTLSVNFNFLTEELTNKTEYTYHLLQREVGTNKLIGGETFEIRKPINSFFDANAGDDEVIDSNQSVTISAEEISGDATYNWYDPDGNLIFTGTDLTVSPEITMTYMLEVISDLDGFKDYDEIQIIVSPNRIESLVPNPVSTQLTIDYVAENVSSAYIMILNQSNAETNNYILDLNSDQVTIDLTSYSIGLYSAILVCDGEICDTSNFVKE